MDLEKRKQAGEDLPVGAVMSLADDMANAAVYIRAANADPHLKKFFGKNLENATARFADWQDPQKASGLEMVKELPRMKLLGEMISSIPYNGFPTSSWNEPGIVNTFMKAWADSANAGDYGDRHRQFNAISKIGTINDPWEEKQNKDGKLLPVPPRDKPNEAMKQILIAASNLPNENEESVKGLARELLVTLSKP